MRRQRSPFSPAFIQLPARIATNSFCDAICSHPGIYGKFGTRSSRGRFRGTVPTVLAMLPVRPPGVGKSAEITPTRVLQQEFPPHARRGPSGVATTLLVFPRRGSLKVQLGGSLEGPSPERWPRVGPLSFEGRARAHSRDSRDGGAQSGCPDRLDSVYPDQ